MSTIIVGIFLLIIYAIFKGVSKKLEVTSDDTIVSEVKESLPEADEISEMSDMYDYDHSKVIMSDAPVAVTKPISKPKPNTKVTTSQPIESIDDNYENIIGDSPEDLRRAIIISEILQRKY